MYSIDLNSDIGESWDGSSLMHDRHILSIVSSCNIACGFHSGDPLTIRKTIDMALDQNVLIGAHPSYPDRDGFGRTNMDIHGEQLAADLAYQLHAFCGMVALSGGKLHHVKPHGAMYNQLMEDKNDAEVLASVVKEINPELKIFGLPGSVMENVCKSHQLTFIPEAFTDRRYNPDGTLRSRNFPDAVLHKPDEILKQLHHLIFEQKAETHDGRLMPVFADSICLHSDTPGALELADIIKKYLVKHDVRIGKNL